MAKIELTRRRILGGLVTIGAGSAAAGAGTFALFSDTEDDTGNNLSAGTVDLELEDSSGVSFKSDDIMPTQTGGDSVELSRFDNGSVPADLTIKVTSVSSSEGDTPTAETETNSPGELDDQLQLQVWIDRDGDDSFDNNDIQLSAPDSSTRNQLTGDGNSLTYQTASNFNDAEFSDVITGFSSAVTFRVDWKFPKGNDNNEAQGDTLTVDFEFVLEQQTSN